MDFMQRALELARQAQGTTSPNPPVGAVLVKDSHIVGEGCTLPPGQSHAEITALQQAGDLARGSTLYVSLEPCCFHGRTPPCTGPLINAGVKEAHIAFIDPNPRVNGRGAKELQQAGIKTYVYDLDTARELYEAFSKHVRTGIPFLTAKFAMSLDGKIATHTGESQWITGEAARRKVHRLRYASDAIITGVNTVIRDNPRLTARAEAGSPSNRHPLRVVVDSNARTPPEAVLLKEPGKTLFAVTHSADAKKIETLRNHGAEILVFPSEKDSGRVALDRLLETLGQRGIVSVLAEGGGVLLGSFFDSGLVDKVLAFIGPVIIGGATAPSPVGGRGSTLLKDALALNITEVEHLDTSVLIKAYPQRKK